MIRIRPAAGPPARQRVSQPYISTANVLPTFRPASPPEGPHDFSLHSPSVGIAQNSRNGLSRAIDDVDRPRIAHARWSDHADRADSIAVAIRRGDQTKRSQVRIGMLGADHDGQARTVDVFVEQPYQPLFFLDELEQ